MSNGRALFLDVFIFALMTALFICARLVWRRAMRLKERSRAQVIDLLEHALITQGDDAWDDFISIKIADPALEVVRLKCDEVNLAPKAVFDETLQSLIKELRSGSR